MELFQIVGDAVQGPLAGAGGEPADHEPIGAPIWRALGANPVPIAFSELYTSLQTGVVDAGENPPINIIRMKFFEVADQVTLTRHSLTTMTLMCNEPWWQGLPEEARTIITDAVREVQPWRRQAAWEADQAAVEELKELGVTISEIEDRSEFEQALLPLYEEFGASTGTSDLIAEIRNTE